MPASALSSEPITASGPLLGKNLDALRAYQPQLADRLAAIRDFGDARIVAGADGHKVVVRSAGPDRLDWLGGSSMPSVSAEAILAGQTDRRCNILLPTAGSGHEIRLLAGRLDDYCAVFVHEPTESTLAMVLSVVDLADIIRRGRLVLLCGDLAEALVTFLNRCPGYDFPGKLYHHPMLDRIALDKCSQAVRAAAHRWQNSWRQTRDDGCSGVRRLKFDPETTLPRLVVLSTDTGPQVRDHAARIERAARKLDWPVGVCIPDRPDRVNILARIDAVHRKRPDLLVVLNGTTASMGMDLPVGLPRACWFLESPTLSAGALQAIENESCILAASGVVRDLLVQRGAHPPAISILEEGVDDSPAAIAAESDAQPAAPVEVVLWGNVLSDSAESAGIALETHAHLWRQLVVEVKRRADHLNRCDLAGCLQAAQQSSGIDLQDEGTRRNLIALAGRRVWPSALAQATLSCLQGVVSRIRVCGTGWHRTDHPAVDWANPPESDARRWCCLAGAKLLVVPHTDASGLVLATEAVLADTLPILRVSESAIDRHRPQSHALLERLPWYGDRNELAGQVRRWLDDDAARHVLLADVRNTLLTEHSTASRLGRLLAIARQSRHRGSTSTMQ